MSANHVRTADSCAQMRINVLTVQVRWSTIRALSESQGHESNSPLVFLLTKIETLFAFLTITSETTHS